MNWLRTTRFSIYQKDKRRRILLATATTVSPGSHFCCLEKAIHRNKHMQDNDKNVELNLYRKTLCSDYFRHTMQVTLFVELFTIYGILS